MFLIQPTTPPVNDNMMELLIMVRPQPLLLGCTWRATAAAVAAAAAAAVWVMTALGLEQ